MKTKQSPNLKLVAPTQTTIFEQMSPWTQFWDMHSGGGLKEAPYARIYIEAPEEEAKKVFYNRFGHNPDRITCTCCGPDYSITESETIEQASGFHRSCVMPNSKRDPVTGLYDNKDPNIRYYEEGEEIPEGYDAGRAFNFGSKGYQTVEQYSKNDDVLIIYAKDIKDEERVGEIPEQGYVWRD